MKSAIVSGIIAVANHKLRLESLEDYKKHLSKKYWSEKDLQEAITKCIDNSKYCLREYKYAFADLKKELELD